ncbi:hypothetical protein [uncultured Tateyamaria sp.]|uniref:hypothetical protein n=1 Tax=uncultured Tateyamaria sp. TaxID=455651 RepID=UPI002634DC9C|nr:hypothetical protein [uncultured Tateyamaria sp.]
MTTIISRVFPDKASADKAGDRLIYRGVPARDCMVISTQDDEKLAADMDAALIDDSAKKAYAKAVKSGNAVLVIHATYKPLTAATIVRETLAKYDTIDVGDVVDDYYVPDGPRSAPRVLGNHPLFLTVRPKRTGYRGRPITPGFGFRLLSARKERTSAIRGGGFKSRMFWPTPLLSKKQRKKSVISGGRYMSKSFWPMPLLSTKERSNSVIRGGDLPFSRALGWPPVA